MPRQPAPKPPLLEPLAPAPQGTRPELFSPEPLPALPDLGTQGPPPTPPSAVAGGLGAFLAAMSNDPVARENVVQAARNAQDLFEKRAESYRREGLDRARIIYEGKLEERAAVRELNARKAIAGEQLKQDARRTEIEAARAAWEQLNRTYSMELEQMQLSAQLGLIDQQAAAASADRYRALMQANNEFLETLTLGASASTRRGSAGGGAAGTGLAVEPSRLEPSLTLQEFYGQNPEAARIVAELRTQQDLAAVDPKAAERVTQLKQELSKLKVTGIAQKFIDAELGVRAAAGAVGAAGGGFSFLDPEKFRSFVENNVPDPTARALFTATLNALPSPGDPATPDQSASLSTLMPALRATSPQLADEIGAAYVDATVAQGYDRERVLDAWADFESGLKPAEEMPGLEELRAILGGLRLGAGVPAAAPPAPPTPAAPSSLATKARLSALGRNQPLQVTIPPKK